MNLFVLIVLLMLLVWTIQAIRLVFSNGQLTFTSFLSKPKWYGAPVMVRANTRPLVRWFAIATGFALLVGIVAAGLVWDLPDERMVLPIQAFVGTVLIIVMAVGIDLFPDNWSKYG